jgi:AMP-binding enzyme C-terminal domain
MWTDGAAPMKLAVRAQDSVSAARRCSRGVSPYRLRNARLSRTDQVINTGYHVYPEEIEDVIRRVPGVADVLVRGEPDPTHGQAIVADLVPTGDRTPRLAHRRRRDRAAFTSGPLQSAPAVRRLPGHSPHLTPDRPAGRRRGRAQWTGWTNW